jgi:hypothetical protein
MSDPRGEPQFVAIRRQAALARALLDELEEIVSPGLDRGRALSAQAIEELTRLGCRIFEAAALLATEEEEASGAPRLAKCLQPHAETEPVGERLASYVRAIERAEG